MRWTRPIRVVLILAGLVAAGLLASSGSITFAQDTTPPSATFTPSDGSEVFRTDLFIIAVYDEQVTLIEVLFGEVGGVPVDVTALVATSDQRRWVYAAAGLVVDEQYTFTISVEDLAGNPSGPESTTFTVKVIALMEIPLFPGWNLVSLPGEPADPDINTVFYFPSDGVDQVVTTAKTGGLADTLSCNPFGTVGPECLIAQRQDGGPLTGDLTTIATGLGYWVHTSTFGTIRVDIPQQAAGGAFPSYTPVYSEWDLVGVMTLDGFPTAGDQISADVYFAGTGWIEAYTYDPQANAYIKLLPNNFDSVTVGKGYYLRVPEDTIVLGTALGGGSAGPSATVIGNQATVPLWPGMNLISLPGEPADPAINTVFAANSSLTSVITYDATQGWFSSATRDAQGQLAGSLTQIVDGQGYWVNETVAVDLVVELTGQDPSYPVVAGWNLVGVTAPPGAPLQDIDGDGSAFEVSADDYFGSAPWRRAFTYDPTDDNWVGVNPQYFQYLQLGKGYWVFMEQTGQLVPFGSFIPATPTPTPTPLPGLHWWGMLLLAGVFGAFLVWRVMHARNAHSEENM